MTFSQWLEQECGNWRPSKEALELAEKAWNAAWTEAEKPVQLVGVRCIYDWSGGDS